MKTLTDAQRIDVILSYEKAVSERTATMRAHAAEWATRFQSQGVDITPEGVRSILKNRKPLLSSLSKSARKAVAKSENPELTAIVRTVASRDGSRFLSLEAEISLVATAKAFDRANMALTKEQMHALIKGQFGKTASVADFSKWFKRFLKRHHEITYKNNKIIPHARVSMSTSTDIERWINANTELREEYKKKYGNYPTAGELANLDEFLIKAASGGGRRISIVRRHASVEKKEQVQGGRGHTIGSLVVVSFADGTTPFLFLVLKPRPGAKLSKAQKEGLTETLTHVLPPDMDVSGATRSSLSIYGTLYRDSGCVDSGAFLVIAKKLVEYTKATRPGKKIVLYMDNLGPHRSVDVLQLLLSSGIFLPLFFVAACTEFMQPLDDLIFAILRNWLNNYVREHGSKTYWIDMPFSELLLQALALPKANEAVEPSKQQLSWERTGVHPFDADKVLKNFASNVGEEELLSKLSTSSTVIDAAAQVALVAINAQKKMTTQETKRRKAREAGVSVKIGRAYDGREVYQMALEQRKKKEEAVIRAARRLLRALRRIGRIVSTTITMARAAAVGGRYVISTGSNAMRSSLVIKWRPPNLRQRWIL